jgi:hypothetical protein|eukprot:CAMPEP_0174280344 /NCGR_PEP_ID=MMETSP0809-20121228/633_1 /TAXON_ID=73025 ORGANISM="Eutreptiella gymnastica-like, Strain CCMP1594" /NCGR_SAMPLE_ID=MMETSP0809 /ASSEMBLY_ACC=CAM_ASM_000658 /LENGTH=237 /DNA_ID=CAMNT_0015373177 /DNA_START=37 /DNA_END=750 /DNA_ORIENTATION=+
MLPTAITAFFALSGTVLTAVATGLARWSKFAAIGGAETRWGLWDFMKQNPLYCEGWVVATAVMIILALCFFFFTLLVALMVLAKKKVAWKTKPLRLIMSLLAFLTFLWTILAVVFWICFNEWPACWMNYSDATWANVNATYQYTKYDVSWMLACAACGIALLMTLTAYWSVAKTPKAPVPPVMEYPAYPAAPVYTTAAPMYPSVVQEVPMYPTAASYAAYPTAQYPVAQAYAPGGYM